MAVLEQADGQVTLVPGYVKLVRDRRTGLRQAAPEGLVDLLLQTDQLILQFLDPLIRRGGGFTLGPLAGLGGVERLGALRAVAINRDTLEPQSPRLVIRVGDIRNRALTGEVHGLGDRPADERLGSGHHLQMRHVVNAAFAPVRFERAIEHIQMFGLEPASTGVPVLLDVLDGVKFFNMRDDLFHLVRRVAQPRQRLGHGAVDDLQRAAAGEQLVLHQRDVRLDTGRVAVHQERDRAGWRQHCDLRVAVAVLVALGQGGLPAVAGGLLQISEIFAWLDLLDGVAVQLHDAAHRLDIVLGQRLGHAGAAGVAVAGEGALHAGQFRRLLVGVPGHDRRDRPGQGAALV